MQILDNSPRQQLSKNAEIILQSHIMSSSDLENEVKINSALIFKTP
jgi:hypothetical protein